MAGWGNNWNNGGGWNGGGGGGFGGGGFGGGGFGGGMRGGARINSIKASTANGYQNS